MKLGDYYNSLPQVKRNEFLSSLSSELKKSEVTIRSYINGNRNVQPEEAKTISEATNNIVTRHDLLPNVFECELPINNQSALR